MSQQALLIDPEHKSVEPVALPPDGSALRAFLGCEEIEEEWAPDLMARVLIDAAATRDAFRLDVYRFVGWSETCAGRALLVGGSRGAPITGTELEVARVRRSLVYPETLFGM